MKERKGGGSGRGLLLGVGLTVAAAALVGAGRSAEQSYHVTATTDGRVVHLWSTNGAQLRYLSSAEVPRSKIRPHDEEETAPVTGPEDDKSADSSGGG